MSSFEDMQNLLDNLTKPVGSLGRLEEYAKKLAFIQDTTAVSVEKRGCYVFAADHGIVDEGVSAFPQEVSGQMLINFVNGGAGINVLSKYCGFDVHVVDAGILEDLQDERIINKRIGAGSANFLYEDALTSDQLSDAMEAGRDLADEAKEKGYTFIAIGDMGIGNTTTAAALCIALGQSADDIIDKGTGISDEMLDHKRDVILRALEARGPFNGSALHALRAVGGFDYAMMVGFMLRLKELRIPFVLDGFPVTSAAYVAYALDPELPLYCFSGHKSKVIGHAAILKAMGLTPVVDQHMRLGEGTGAVIGGFIISLGAAIANEMASFADAGVSAGDDDTSY